MEYFNRDVDTCCCCFGLRTGNIVMGVTNAIFSGAGVFVLLLSQGYDEQTGLSEPYSTGTIIMLIAFTCKFLFDLLFVYGVVRGLQKIVKAYAIMYLVFLCIWVVLMVTAIVSLQWVHFVNLFLHLFFDGYAYIVCRSFYRKLQSQEIP